MSWDNYRYILAIYRYKTIGAAARSLGVNETTVSRRLAQTEKYLHYKLFLRRSTGLVPTHAGMQLLERIESIKTEFDEVEEQVSFGKSQVAGSVRIASDVSLLDHILVPRLAVLMKQYPELRFELLSANSGERNHDADFVIQFGEPLPSVQRIACELGEISYATFVADEINNVHEHTSLPWVVCQSAQGGCSGKGVFPGYETSGSSEVSTPYRLVVDNFGTQLSCVHSGLGKSLLPIGIGMQDPRLKRLDVEEAVHTCELWLSCQTEYLSTPRAQVCKSWLEQCVSSFNFL